VTGRSHESDHENLRPIEKMDDSTVTPARPGGNRPADTPYAVGHPSREDEGVRFTEHELTAALTGAAKAVLATQRRDVRRGKVDVDTAWDELGRYQRFQLLDQLGGQILPVLVALPDVEVSAGTRPSYTDREVSETVDAVVGDSGGKLRRAVMVKMRTALVQSALAHLPPRQDPDALIVPDHL
jgi:hypothetical protein